RQSPVAGNPGTPGREAGATPFHPRAEIGHRERCLHYRDSSDVRWGLRHRPGRRHCGHIEPQIRSQVTSAAGILVLATEMQIGVSAWNAAAKMNSGEGDGV